MPSNRPAPMPPVPLETICRAIAAAHAQSPTQALLFGQLADAIFGTTSGVDAISREGRALDRGLQAARRAGFITYRGMLRGWFLTPKGTEHIAILNAARAPLPAV